MELLRRSLKMFGKKKENPFLKIFENLNTDNEPEDDTETERILIKDKIKSFFQNFRYQSLTYQVVWFIRILSWLLICAAAIYGVVIRIKNIF